ncbi:MAG: hypothetical protein J0I08_00770 [Rhizobiales bacterium]|nr:hypothetical protein [Hyphomicrobiales bacterium]
MSARSKARLVELVGATLESLDFDEVPIHMLVSKLTELSEELIHEGPGGDDRIAVFVRLGRNASSANRHARMSAGLHWHGRDGGWVGQVTKMQLAKLREAFGDRLSGAKAQEAQSSPKEQTYVAPEAVSTDVVAMLPLAEDKENQKERAIRGNRLPSTLTPPSFAFPLRRPGSV